MKYENCGSRRQEALIDSVTLRFHLFASTFLPALLRTFPIHKFKVPCEISLHDTTVPPAHRAEICKETGQICLKNFLRTVGKRIAIGGHKSASERQDRGGD